MALPTLRCRPARVRGTPSWRESLALALDRPTARFHENDNPGMPFRRLLRLTMNPRRMELGSGNFPCSEVYFTGCMVVTLGADGVTTQP